MSEGGVAVVGEGGYGIVPSDGDGIFVSEGGPGNGSGDGEGTVVSDGGVGSVLSDGGVGFILSDDNAGCIVNGRGVGIPLSDSCADIFLSDGDARRFLMTCRSYVFRKWVIVWVGQVVCNGAGDVGWCSYPRSIAGSDSVRLVVLYGEQAAFNEACTADHI